MKFCWMSLFYLILGFDLLTTFLFAEENDFAEVDLPPLSLGMSNLRSIRNKKAIYVDRTELAWKLINAGDYFLFMRPRRFGKSLFLDTLQAILKGEKDVLEGTWVSGQMESIKQHTIFFFDFDDLDTIEAFEEKIIRYAEEHGFESELQADRVKYPKSSLFKLLIKRARKPVAILIDEYNMIFESSNQSTRVYFFKFYQEMKTMLGPEKELNFVFLTGCDKVKLIKRSQSGLGTTLGIQDISDMNEYAHICGFTLEDIKMYFSGYIDRRRKFLGWNVSFVHDQITDHYDGYKFGTTNTKLFNPVSIMSYLTYYYIPVPENYWLKTVDHPDTILNEIIADRVSKKKVAINLRQHFKKGELYDYAHENQHIEALKTVQTKVKGIRDKSFESTLYRYGYLTVDYYDPVKNNYYLRIPNREVHEAFLDAITKALRKKPKQVKANLEAWKNLENGDMNAFASIYNDFLQEYWELVIFSNRERESFYKTILEALLNIGKEEPNVVYREKCTPRFNDSVSVRYDFVLGMESKQELLEFKYESSLKQFSTVDLDQTTNYTIPEDLGKPGDTRQWYLLNLGQSGITQWYGPIEHPANHVFNEKLLHDVL